MKEAIPRAGFVGSLCGGEREGQPELDLVAFGPRVAVAAHLEREATWHDAHDRVGLARPAETHVLSHSGRVAAGQPLPQPVAQDDLPVRSGLALGIGERAPERRLHLQHAKERRGGAHPAKLLRRPVDRQRVEPVGEHPLAFERGERLQPIEVRRDGVGEDVIRRDRRVHLAQCDDAVRVRHRQGPQQHRVDDSERGDVGAEADGERQDGGRAEAEVPAQEPEGRAEILGQTLHRALPHDGAQRAKRQAAGARAGCRALTMAPSASSTCAANVFQSGRPRCNSRQASSSERPRERRASYASSSCAASSSTIWSSR